MCEGEALLNPHGQRSARVPEVGAGWHGWLIEVAVTIFRSLGVLPVRTFDFFFHFGKKKKRKHKSVAHLTNSDLAVQVLSARTVWQATRGAAHIKITA